MKKMNKKGFTIVELVIVIAVIAILSAVLIPTFSGVVTEAKLTAAMSDARAEYQEYIRTELGKGNDIAGTADFIYTNDEKVVVLIINGEVGDAFNSFADIKGYTIKTSEADDATVITTAPTDKITKAHIVKNS
jgi:type IV pilus assembly protein PilA